jgi:hypothetical protein
MRVGKQSGMVFSVESHKFHSENRIGIPAARPEVQRSEQTTKLAQHC